MRTGQNQQEFGPAAGEQLIESVSRDSPTSNLNIYLFIYIYLFVFPYLCWDASEMRTFYLQEATLKKKAPLFLYFRRVPTLLRIKSLHHKSLQLY